MQRGETQMTDPTDDEIVRALLTGRVASIYEEYDWTEDDVLARAKAISRQIDAAIREFRARPDSGAPGQ